MTHAPSRRELLLASGTLFAWSYVPKLARAEGRDPRFLTIVLRGALDGLATVAPVGDPEARMKAAQIPPAGAREKKPTGPVSGPFSAPPTPQLRAYFAETVGTAA